MNDVAELRTAAKLIRRRGTEATPGPWRRPLDVRHKDVVQADLPDGERPQVWRGGIDSDGRRERVTVVRVPTLDLTGQHIRQRAGRDLEWIALMDPRVADHIAGWLEAARTIWSPPRPPLPSGVRSSSSSTPTTSTSPTPSAAPWTSRGSSTGPHHDPHPRNPRRPRPHRR
ncbi:hypothetical protein [Actinomadura sp. CNU-125]|uniref:hypothetical protein n=1 Tax=Actinomadura sp. CNU-125 TaxID=1904961 RepID=UPI0021CD14B1|nr:hypothetical protein [Actinomadura sp. CNU-125]